MTAKKLISQTFTQKKKAGSSYFLVWPCSGCGNERKADIVLFWDVVTEEYSGIGGVRPDLFFSGKRPFALEVVVTHAPENSSLDIFEHENTPVFEYWPDWESLTTLSQKIECKRGHYENASRCVTCSHRSAGLTEAKKASTMLRQILKSRCKASSLAVLPWTKDRLGDPIYSRALESVLTKARILVQYGFTQVLHKRWLFFLDYDEQCTVYVDFGGRIWEDPRPLVYWDLKGAPRSRLYTDKCWPVEYGLYSGLMQFLMTVGIDGFYRQREFLCYGALEAVGLKPSLNKDDWLVLEQDE